MSSVAPADPFEYWRRALHLDSMPELLKTGGREFWRNQDHVVDCLENLSRDWFERRHQATRAAQDVLVKMRAAGNPIDAVREYQQWASGAFDRLMSDAAALQQFGTVVGAALFEPVSSPLESSKISTSHPPSVGRTTNAA